MAAMCAKQTYAMKRRTSALDRERCHSESMLRERRRPPGPNRLAGYGIIEFIDILLRSAETLPIINPDDKFDRAIESVSPRPPILRKGETTG
jgi:hypothetical protein